MFLLMVYLVLRSVVLRVGTVILVSLNNCGLIVTLDVSEASLSSMISGSNSLDHQELSYVLLAFWFGSCKQYSV